MGQSISYPGAKDSFLFFDLYLSGPVLKPPIQQRKERVAARIVLQLIDGISQGRGWSAICKRAGAPISPVMECRTGAQIWVSESDLSALKTSNLRKVDC